MEAITTLLLAVVIFPEVKLRVPATVASPPKVQPLVLFIVRLLKVKVGIVCAAEPLKATVLPVLVNALVPGVNVPAIPIVPLLANVLAPVLLLVTL